MDPVTADLLFTLLICLSLTLLSMIALRLLPQTPDQIQADAQALGRVLAIARARINPVFRPAFARIDRHS